MTAESLAAAVDSEINQLIERLADIMRAHDVSPEEMAETITEFGGAELAAIWLDSAADLADDEPDPDATRDRLIDQQIERM